VSESSSAPPFPREAIPASEFFERYLAEQIASRGVPPAARALELTLGVALTGSKGGEWTLRLAGGALALRAEARARAGISLIQSVGDFETALWSEPGAPLRSLLRSEWPTGSLTETEAAGVASRAARVFAELSALDALLRLRITGLASGIWTLDARLGPGALAREPDAVITLPIEVAEALLAGRLRPLDALLKIQIEGDYGLLLAAFGALKSASS
jgi:hypothetical protein